MNTTEQEYKTRVIEEYQELKEKITKLKNYLEVAPLQDSGLFLLQAQLKAMKDYLAILGCRAELEDIKLEETENVNMFDRVIGAFGEYVQSLISNQETNGEQLEDIEVPDDNKTVLKNHHTCELVKELETREGVSTDIALPYEDKTTTVNGPAIILTVID